MEIYLISNIRVLNIITLAQSISFQPNKAQPVLQLPALAKCGNGTTNNKQRLLKLNKMGYLNSF